MRKIVGLGVMVLCLLLVKLPIAAAQPSVLLNMAKQQVFVDGMLNLEVQEKINQKLVTKLNTNRKVGVYFQAKANASTLEQLEEYIMKQENKFGNTERVQELKRQRDALMGHLQEFQFFDSNEN